MDTYRLFFSYAVPQENGNKMDTRKLELADGWNPHYFKPGATWQSGLAGEMTWGDGGVPWEQRRLPTGKGQVLKYAFELR